MPMLMTLRMRLPVWPFHAAPGAVGESPPSCRARRGLRDHVLAINDDGSAFGAQKPTCKTARFPSVMLIFSPLNMPSMRSRGPDSCQL